VRPLSIAFVALSLFLVVPLAAHAQTGASLSGVATIRSREHKENL